MPGAIHNPNIFLSESSSNLHLRSETPSTVLPHPQQKAMSPSSPYIVAHHIDVAHHNDVAYHGGENGHQYYSDNNNQNDYSMSGHGCLSYPMVHPAMQQSMQSYYPGSPNSPEALANKTLTELNSLPPYNTDSHDQVTVCLKF
jgi:hypothetical protein